MGAAPGARTPTRPLLRPANTGLRSHVSDCVCRIACQIWLVYVSGRCLCVEPTFGPSDGVFCKLLDRLLAMDDGCREKVTVAVSGSCRSDGSSGYPGRCLLHPLFHGHRISFSRSDLNPIFFVSCIKRWVMGLKRVLTVGWPG